MRHLPFILLALGLLLAGCDSVPSRVRERFATVPPKTLTIDADRRTAYYSAQLALRKIGCTVSRSDISAGTLEAYRPIQSSLGSRDASQITLSIRLRDIEPARTEVSVLVHELQTGDFPGGSMDRPLRDHSLYEAYFATLEQVVKDKEAVKTPAN